MSRIQRYSCLPKRQMKLDPDGEWVRYDDIKHLLPTAPEIMVEVTRTETPWALYGMAAGYFVWQRYDGGMEIYQVTLADTPPQTDSGYFNLGLLLKMKGVKTNDFKRTD